MKFIYIKENSYRIIYYLLNILPYNFFEKINYIIRNNTIVLTIKKNNLKFLMNFVKKHHLLQFKTLIAITAVDYPDKENRFELNYFLLSYKLNFRLIVKTHTNDVFPVESITSIFEGASWYEREVWDLFGIYFSNHPDLRRILTDYGFDGFPFRKDFPQTGFLEVRYDDEKKYVLYEPIEIAQEFRSFDFATPWLNVK